MVTVKILQSLACPFIRRPLLAPNVARSAKFARIARFASFYRSLQCNARCAPPGKFCLTSPTLRRERATDDGASFPIAGLYLTRFARLLSLTGSELQSKLFVLLWITFFISVETIIAFIGSILEVKFTKC